MAQNLNKKNYKYGKIVDYGIEYAPYYLTIGKKTYVNAPASKYLSQGWKLIVDGEVPDITEEEIEDGWYINTSYTEDERCVYIIYTKQKTILE